METKFQVGNPQGWGQDIWKNFEKGLVMAEDVNFHLDQTRNTSTFQFLREALRESDRPRRIEDQEAKQNIAESERRELQTSRDVADPDRIEGPEYRIQEGLGTNSLLGPRPSKLRDDSDASAVETERGQNVSSLI